MPNWLRKMLEDGPRITYTNRIGPDGTIMRLEIVANETPNLVPVLARLSHLDRSVERAFYCTPELRHVCKVPREGGFCGYRNIQMMISYIQDAEATGSKHFPGERLPSILKLQQLIEDAWDKGFNASGRVETGGIKDTRKYIGTPEAQALLMSLQIPCEATAYTTTKEVDAFETMLCAVCEYFDDDSSKDNVDKVVVTDKPPIYFQHRGHSMTIVGLEQRLDGVLNLVVFDPMFNPSPALKKLALANTTAFRSPEPEKLLKAHRRGEKYLQKYKEFELLKLK
jgi:zinc finger-containing ubiquitin peptidase 1